MIPITASLIGFGVGFSFGSRCASEPRAGTPTSTVGIDP